MELFYLIRRENLDEFVVEFTKLENPNANAQDWEGNSYLHIACTIENTEFVSTLLSHPFLCDINLQNQDGKTPLMIAALNHDVKTMQVFSIVALISLSLIVLGEMFSFLLHGK